MFGGYIEGYKAENPWPRRIWIAFLVILVAGAFVYLTHTVREIVSGPQEVNPSPVLERLQEHNREVKEALESVQKAIPRAQERVIVHEKEISREITDLDLVGLADRWNAVVADERARRSRGVDEPSTGGESRAVVLQAGGY